ncbi:MAG: F0F1 ATP synthase subunit A [Capsulimonadaceae bacterium]|nr:F0F1 ATP synthase subunit A [Capsulimonadaceae bacterium]
MEELSKPIVIVWYLINSLIAGGIVFALLRAAASKMKKVPGRYQNFFEWSIEALRGLFMGALGPGGERHLPLVFTLFFYILIGNFLGLVPGFKSPSAHPSITIALGIIVFIYVQWIGITSNGIIGYLKHFMGPLLILAPLFILIEIIGELSKPFSLAMRLFGNIFGEDQLVDMVFKAQGNSVILHLIPFQFLFNLLQAFTNCIQAFIFALLTCSYIALMSAHHDDDEDAHASAGSHGAPAN